MNDRITELAIQTDIWCDQNVAQGSPAYNNLWERKFAELIVRECAGLFKNVYVEIEHDHGHTPVIASDYIKKHFGVEE